MTGFASCPGIVIITLITSLISIPVKAEIWTNEISDVQYGRIGSNVTLLCSASRNGSAVEWRLNGTRVVSSFAVLQNGNLILTNSDSTMEGNYSCHDKKGQLLRATALRLGYGPALLRIHCIAANYYSICCSWEQNVKTFLPTEYISTFRHASKASETCHQDFFRTNVCTIKNPKNWHSSYVVNITEVNPLGSTFTLSRIQFLDIVKPDPPERVSAEPVHGSPRRLRVYWEYPATWPKESSFPLRFQVQYKPVESRSWSVVEATHLTTELTDVLAGHFHIIQVRAMDLLGNGNWSEWSTEIKALPWLEPTPKPEESESSTQSHTENTDHSSTSESKVESEEQYEKLALLVSLGSLGGVFLALLAFFTILIWVRHKGKEETSKQELTSMMKMKSLPM